MGEDNIHPMVFEGQLVWVIHAAWEIDAIMITTVIARAFHQC
jgi:hypothetical protein